MLIINFAHPLTPEQVEQVERITQQQVINVVAIATQFDTVMAFENQARFLVDQVGLSSQEWQTTPLLLILPGLNFGAATILAELHGRCGYFPPVVRLRPVPDVVPPKFEVAEILDLQRIRERARETR